MRNGGLLQTCLHILCRVHLVASDTGTRLHIPVSLNQQIIIDADHLLQAIDILRVVAQQQSFVLKNTDEGVSERGLVRFSQILLCVSTTTFALQDRTNSTSPDC